jgi:hypothetical protein
MKSEESGAEVKYELDDDDDDNEDDDNDYDPSDFVEVPRPSKRRKVPPGGEKKEACRLCGNKYAQVRLSIVL